MEWFIQPGGMERESLGRGVSGELVLGEGRGGKGRGGNEICYVWRLVGGGIGSLLIFQDCFEWGYDLWGVRKA